MKMTSYFNTVLKSRTMMVKFTFAMTAHGKANWDSARSDLPVALEASFSCPRYFTHLSKQKADWSNVSPVKQENLFP